MTHFFFSEPRFQRFDIFFPFTFDSTCNMAFGADPGSLSLDLHSVPFINAQDDMLEVMFFRHVVPMGWWKLLRWLHVGKEKKMALALETIENFLAVRIAERMDERRYWHGPHMVLLVVSQRPDVERKILDELKPIITGLPESRRRDPVVFRVDDLSSAVYLEATLREALRLFPPVPLEYKCAARADVLPSGHKVDPKAKIVIPLYAMARVEGIWGKGCCEFKPERWISDDGKLKHESFVQVKVVAATLLHDFSITVVKGHVVAPSLSIIFA
ncbi:unnamed protein product [Spirodela intermedia]|uniref:Uncharacterized protein n=1 Tax=Spirodela intermedia TaxID=51605 RepID=A0A7I8J830_SPIIN|nr:unnamed protein product [Spirodela intermedia]CAA6666234.1 unnamed protein product [Spirodela intermedia]